MARLNKFASVNLNDSYGKPDRGGSASSSNNGNTSGSGKPRISSPGGMLVLSRPGRTQPPSPKPGQPRLGIPSPVNLPSLKRETSSGDTLAASPPISGWSKGESPPLPGWSKGESPSTEASPLNQKVGLSRSLDTVGESLKAMSTGKPDIYAPPAMRAAMQAGSIARALPPTPPQPEKPSAIIRGEEFPTLQAAVARPPTPPQHSRQKDLQLKQREKQQEAKEQQLKLHQLSQAQEHKQIQAGFVESSNGGLQSQPPTLSLRPLGKPEGAYQRSSLEASGPDPSLHSHFGGQGSNLHPDGSFSWSPPAGLSSQSVVSKGSSAFVDRSLSRSPPLGIPSQGNPTRVDDARESGHSFRPQYRSHLPVSQSSSSVEARQPGFQTNLEPSWVSSSRRDFVPSPREIDYAKPAGDARTSIGEDMGRTVSEMRSAAYARESYISKDSLSYREGNSVSGYVREDKCLEQGGFSRENFDHRNFGRSSSLIHDGVPRIEGFHSQRSSVREVYNRESREGNNRESREVLNRDSRAGNTRVNRESGLRDNNIDSYNTENFSRDSGDIYDRDVKEAYSRDSRNVYSRDVREVSQDLPMSKQVGYGYASNNNGDISWRGHAEGRGPGSPAGISPAHNPGSGYDAYYGKRYGSQGMGDQSSTREVRAGIDPRAPRSQHMEPAGPYSSTSEIIGSRRVRSPVLNNTSFDSVKEVHEVRSDRPLYAEDRQARYEDKVMDVKGAGNESYGSSLNAQRPVSKRDSTQGFGTRTIQTSTNKKPEDDRSSREDVRKQLALEDERRKEAARLKLTELEERMARRAVEGRKEEVEVKGKEFLVEAASFKQQDVEQVPSDAHFDSTAVAPVHDRDNDISWGEEDSGLKLARPSSASSACSWTYRSPGEGATSQELDSRLFGESELNQQDRKVVRSRSPSSWRKEIGGGPTSKLFSSPYIESGGFRRPSDGGTYKLF